MESWALTKMPADGKYFVGTTNVGKTALLALGTGQSLLSLS
jgi:hypothetical protein